MQHRHYRVDARMALAFAAIYVLWGGTFLAIRLAVLELPPLFASGVRFLIAGGALYVFMRVRGDASPSLREWQSIALTSLCLFVATYAALFWAEQYVPSGVASVIEATLPITAMVLEVFLFRQQRFHLRTGAALLLGFLGVAWLLIRNQHTFPVFPCLIILASGAAWSLGAVLTRSMRRPRSLPLTAGAQMMLGGMVLLALSKATGELHTLPRITPQAAAALLYLIVAGSLLGFTAYVWLLARMPVTRVASHAYVNPLIALALGYFVAREALTPSMLLASALVIASVVLILTAPEDRERGIALRLKSSGRRRTHDSQSLAR
ncbi:MAG TPA: EamA family transporter [Steroidobacteraceae bacterium]|nr:EamA family transporter [Steroidobacteraceae bacterium]